MHNRNHATSKKREARWDALNAASGNALESRVQQLLHQRVELSVMDARIKVLAEDGWSAMKIAQALSIEEKTVYNHDSKMRIIAGVKRDIPFRAVFLNLPDKGMKGK